MHQTFLNPSISHGVLANRIVLKIKLCSVISFQFSSAEINGFPACNGLDKETNVILRKMNNYQMASANYLRWQDLHHPGASHQIPEHFHSVETAQICQWWQFLPDLARTALHPMNSYFRWTETLVSNHSNLMQADIKLLKQSSANNRHAHLIFLCFPSNLHVYSAYFPVSMFSFGLFPFPILFSAVWNLAWSSVS